MAAVGVTFSGAVLTGGASRRMGRDKALLEVNGRPLAVGVAAVLADAGAKEVFAVGGNRAALEAVGLGVVADHYPGQGPLGGLVSALAHAREPVVVVLACDLAHPSTEAVRAVVDALASDEALAWAVPVLGGRRQLVHGAWRRSAHCALADAFESGERSLVGALAGLAGIDVSGIDPAALADLDTPGDLAEPERPSR